MLVDSGPPFLLLVFALTTMFAVFMGFAAFLAVLPLAFAGRCSRAVKTSSLTVGLLCVPAYSAIFLIGREALQDDGFLTMIMTAFHATGLLLAAVAGTVVRTRHRCGAVAR